MSCCNIYNPAITQNYKLSTCPTHIKTVPLIASSGQFQFTGYKKIEKDLNEETTYKGHQKII
jgi:hypothetical protein